MKVFRYFLSLGLGVLMATPSFSAPIFPNSIVSNDLEFIKTSDQSVFSCMAYLGTDRAEMPDKRSDALFADDAFMFEARYKDGSVVGLWAHPDFGSEDNALKSVEPIAQAIGKLPTLMRGKLDHVVVHKGDETAFGEADGNFFVLYSENIKTRIRNHDLEETVFHESVHATLDSQYLRSKTWRKAQQADGAYITEYAQSQPDKEDMAESALFAWTLLVHPNRLPQNIEAQTTSIMPNRLAFFEELFLSKPLFYSVGSDQGC